MKKHLFTLLLLIGLSFYACDNSMNTPEVLSVDRQVVVTTLNEIENIDEDVVKQVAGAYMQQGQTRNDTGKQIEEVLSIPNEKGETMMYVVNYSDNKGYVVLSAKNEYQPVLAFSETGNFNVSEVNNNGTSVWVEEQIHAIQNVSALPDSIRMQNKNAWNSFFKEKKSIQLASAEQTRASIPTEYEVGVYIEESLQKWSDEGYEIHSYGDGSELEQFFTDTEIKEIKNNLEAYADKQFFNGLAITVYIRIAYKADNAEILPLLNTTWGQTGGYATHVPNDYAGCVAVAMGQIMRYHEYPSLYNWGAMAYTYATDMTAQFLAEIGTKVDMDYKPNGSSSNITKACNAFKGYGYKQSSVVSHNASTVEGQLSKGNPVYMRGVNTSKGGHAWVCDGYKRTKTIAYYEVMALDRAVFDHEKIPYYSCMFSCNKNAGYSAYYHMNWGWSGYNDGFYSDTSSSVEFLKDRKDIINIYPSK